MKRIRRIIRPMLCMVVLLFAMTTGVMGYYQKDRDPIEDPTGTSEVLCVRTICFVWRKRNSAASERDARPLRCPMFAYRFMPAALLFSHVVIGFFTPPKPAR